MQSASGACGRPIPTNLACPACLSNMTKREKGLAEYDCRPCGDRWVRIDGPTHAKTDS